MRETLTDLFGGEEGPAGFIAFGYDNDGGSFLALPAAL
jgi:hypothetical protein